MAFFLVDEIMPLQNWFSSKCKVLCRYSTFVMVTQYMYMQKWSSRSLWLGWLLANIMGAIAGALLTTLMGVKYATEYPGLLIFGTLTAFSVSICQALIIYQKTVSQYREIIFFGWIIISGVCSLILIALAPFIMFFLFYVLSSLQNVNHFFLVMGSELMQIPSLCMIFGLISGTITGFLQHFIFPEFKRRKKIQWIIFSGCGAALGFGIAGIVVSMTFPEPFFVFANISGDAKSLGMEGMTVFNFISGSINGAITGVQLVRIFRC